MTPTWAGTFVPYDRELLLVLERPEDLWRGCWELLRIGFDLPRCWLAGGMQAWRITSLPAPLWSVEELQQRLKGKGAPLIVDAAPAGRMGEARIPEALFITGARLPEALHELP